MRTLRRLLCALAWRVQGIAWALAIWLDPEQPRGGDGPITDDELRRARRVREVLDAAIAADRKRRAVAN
jgi:hypothetical protein